MNDKIDMSYLGSKRSYTIKEIFKDQDHWSWFQVRHPDIPSYKVKEVEKMLACRDPEKGGYFKYSCPTHPEQSIIVPKTCKSGACSSCGALAGDTWVKKALDLFPDTTFRHVTFTVPAELREVFVHAPKTFVALLHKACSHIVTTWCKEHGFLPAVTTGVHTFGRDLKIHPHIHMLVSTGGIDLHTDKDWKEYDYLPERMLKKRFKAVLLALLRQKDLINSTLSDKLYRYDWYVALGCEHAPLETTVRYIGRYIKRPPLSQKHIIGYSPHSEMVLFEYQDHYDGKAWKTKVVSVDEFMGLILQHILPPHTRRINHYGLMHSKVRGNYQTVLDQLKKRNVKKRRQAKKGLSGCGDWRQRQTDYRGKDPLLCPVCSQEMVLVAIGRYSKKEGMVIVVNVGNTKTKEN